MPTGIYKRKPFTEEHKYRISIGKKGNNGRWGTHHTEKTKRKMSISAKERGFTKEWRKNIGLSRRGQRNSPDTEFKRGEHCGIEHPNWKGGITPINQKIRASFEYKLWRKSVFKRDNWTCLVCGQVGGELNAHHIKSFKDYPVLRFEISNGITMCRKCHQIGKKEIPLFFIGGK